MSKCDVCGNDYDKCFTVVQGQRSGTFDSFECAIHAFAPSCAHCRGRIIVHGVEAAVRFYCCAHCAQHAGVEGMVDRRP